MLMHLPEGAATPDIRSQTGRSFWAKFSSDALNQQLFCMVQPAPAELIDLIGRIPCAARFRPSDAARHIRDVKDQVAFGRQAEQRHDAVLDFHDAHGPNPGGWRGVSWRSPGLRRLSADEFAKAAEWLRDEVQTA